MRRWDSSGRVDLHVEVDDAGRTDDRRSDFDEVYGDWGCSASRSTPAPSGAAGSSATVARRSSATSRRRCAPRSATPPALTDDEALALAARGRPGLDALAGARRRPARARSNGDTVTYVVNRNINFTNVCYTGCRFCAFAQRRTDPDAYTLSLDEVADRAEEAWAVGRHRGLHAGRHRPGAAGDRLLRPGRAR